MNIKKMSRGEWRRVTAKKQIICDYSFAQKNGKISLLRILEVRKPFIMHYENEAVKLADKNYSWVQLAMENDFAWFTVMFDEQDRFLQIYIDVTAGNHTGDDDPWFEDLYLDYVIDEKQIMKLDLDELEAAYAKGILTAAEYQEILAHGRMIEEYLKEHHQDLIVFFKDLLARLKKDMDQTD